MGAPLHILGADRMKLAFSSNAYMRFSIEQTIARVAAAGYAGHRNPGRCAARLARVAVAGTQTVDSRPLAAISVDDLERQRLHDECRRRPRQPYWHPGWTDPDPHYRAIRREHTRRARNWPRNWGRRASPPSPAVAWLSDKIGSRPASCFMRS